MMQGLFEGNVSLHTVLVAVIPTLAIAWLAAFIASRLARRLLMALVGDHLSLASPLVRGPLRLVALAVFLLCAALLLFPAFELAGVRPRTGVPLRSLVEWVFGHGLRVLLIGVLAYALIRATGLLVRRFEHEVSQGTTLDALERAKRARTLGSLISNVATASITGVAVLTVLYEFGLNITPFLTGAGIAGLAVGFGAQTLVRDIISGFFMILEDQLRVGDVASINGVGGLVEEINLRTIVLRDEEGTVHVFPNGSITTLANRSKHFSYYVISLAIPYHEDVDRVTGILRELGAELQRDPYYGTFILEPLEIMGVDAFTDWAMQLKMRIKTVPLRQHEVGREMRKRIRRALDTAGIAVPFPERIVAVREGVDRAAAKGAANQ
jgi:moderate conductance mechanosensitive channel